MIRELIERLTPDEKGVLFDRAMTFLGYKNEIADLRESMKEQVKAAKEEIGSLKKGDVGKIFSYLRKVKTPQELRNDAEALEELKAIFK